MPRSFRPALPLLALAIVSLLAALWAGLIRLGWAWPILRPTLPMAHGPLMIGGFLGALISLERAVSLAEGQTGRARWLPYWAPLTAGLGGLLALLGLGAWVGPLLITLGSLGLIVLMARIYRLHPALHTAVIGAGALVWLFGNLRWLAGRPVPAVVLWWQVFLILTIAGERLELSRLLRPSRNSQAFCVVAVGVLLLGCLVSIFDLAMGVRVAGVGMLMLAGWLLVFDIARRRLRAGGQARYIAIALLSGYVWLGVGGVLALAFGGATAGLTYDALLHAVFLGFVFSMIFAHALIIFPAVLNRPLSYRPRFYVHLALLHLSLVLRLAGDLAGQLAWRRWGGLLNEIAILLFLISTIVAVLQSRRVA